MSAEQYLNEKFGLTGKTAVVIGGAGELCGKMAGGLAAAGANIVIVDLNEEKAKEKLEGMSQHAGKHWFESCDVSTSANLKAMLDAVLKKTDKVDILINGAGINSATPFLEIKEDEFDRIMGLNLRSIFLSCQIFGGYFLDNKIAGSIINLGSISGLIPLSRVFTYSMSKGAVHNLSKNLAREWAPSQRCREILYSVAL